jgi:hypothetical protein
VRLNRQTTEAPNENRPARPCELTLTPTPFNTTCALSVYEEQAKLGVIERVGAVGVQRLVEQPVIKTAPSPPLSDPRLHRSHFQRQVPAPECE